MRFKPYLSLVCLKALVIVTVCSGIVQPPTAQAAESGVGIYVLGYSSSMAGFLPPPGFYLRNDFNVVNGTATILPISGLTEANLRARTTLNIINGTVVTPWKILGANYGAGIAWGAVVNFFLKSQLDIAGRFEATRQGDRTDFGDIILVPIILGWHKGPWHIAANFTVYAPGGTYNPNRVLNTSLNRWAFEPNLGITWLHPKIGTEVSAYLGYTFNLQNPATKYTTGQEFHLDWFVGQHLPKGFALGLVGFFYQQATGDSGSGATLGDFKGQAVALGPCVTFNSKIGRYPIGVNLRYYRNVTVTNRMDGDSIWATLTFGMPGGKGQPPPPK